MIAPLLAALAIASPCHVQGTGLLTSPDPVCTPGAYHHLTHTEVCTPKTRPTLPAAVRRRILARYGLTGWSGASGELDHRQPFSLGGTTDVANVWPEAGPIPDGKDRLEAYVWRRVCRGVPYPMSLRSARVVFAGSWVASFRYYGLDKETR